ncbi:endosome-associated-trafficking regulator 1 [Aplochiton taeniatus]
MSKHKSSTKTLIIQDDDVLDEDQMNPFSFKEFIRCKKQTPDLDRENTPLKKSNGSISILQSNRDYPSQGRLDPFPSSCFFPEPSLLPDALDTQDEEEDEEEGGWAGSYQPAAVEVEAGEFGPRATDSTYSDHTSLCSEGEEEEEEEEEDSSAVYSAPSLWKQDEEVTRFSPEGSLGRRGGGGCGGGGGGGGGGGAVNYEGDDETSIAEPVNCYKSRNSSRNQLQQLKEENLRLRKTIKDLQKKSDNDDQRVCQVMEELQQRRIREEREAQALETMVHSVEQNLHLMTKRALKAESTVSKLRQELQHIQGQSEAFRAENDRLKAMESVTVTTMKHNALLASEHLSKAVGNAETSIRQLLSGAETLSLVSQLLHSIDNISEIHTEP